MIRVKSTLAALGAASLLGISGLAQAGATLDAVQKKGFVQCGISDGLPGFSFADAKGQFQGIDVDVCRAVAAAVFGDATKVKYSPLTAKERFTALQSGEVDPPRSVSPRCSRGKWMCCRAIPPGPARGTPRWG